jgi:SOS-response transcriptional repressor LexA
MPTDHRARLATVKRFDQLIAYLRDEMGWPIARDSFEEVDDLFYDFTADELGIDPKTAAKIQEIKRLRPLSPKQPWGIFFVKFEPKKLPVVALRRILSQVALKKRASANSAERAAWAADDLLFVSNYGEGDERQISFAHFSRAQEGTDLPTLRVLGWDNLDTALHLDAVARELTEHLAWPEDDADAAAWRERWRAAFTLRHREVVTTSKELSIRLAELARNIRDRIRTALAIETDKGPLTRLMKAFQEALVHDLDADGFADMYAQTIAYGLLSARIADPHKKTADDFAAHMRTNPFLRELMETFLKVGGRRGKAGGPGIDFDELGVSEVVDLLDEANMEAVVRDFGDRNPQEDPVIHFYELFLKEYDAKKRMQRGVFYTPRPVVSYIVRSVDELLRTELGLADGLADTTTWREMAKRHKDLKIPDDVSPDQDFVQILDPATGTGTFLVEAIDLIHQTLVAKWKGRRLDEKAIDVLWNEYVPRHLLTRLHGYELLMAPYAIAHLKIGLKLYETGYRFGSNERARVYLTNALEPSSDIQLRTSILPALAHEAQASNEIKRKARFTVVIGNPPYAKSSSNRSNVAESLVSEYKGLVHEETNVQPLSDDYLKFIAFAFKASVPYASLIGVITNRSYLEGLIHRGMRSILAHRCSRILVIDLHGDSNVGERPPEGMANENIFDIQQGVAISIFSRWLSREGAAGLLRWDLWGTREEKWRALLEGCAGSDATALQLSAPYWFFASKDLDTQHEQASWVAVDSLFYVSGMGVKSRRDHFLIAENKAALRERMSQLASRNNVERLRSELDVTDNPQWTLARMRNLLRREGVEECLRPILYRPFDTRFIWYHREAIERGDARWPVMKHILQDGLSLLTSRQSVNHDFTSVFVARGLSEMKAAESTRGSYAFPAEQHEDTDRLSLSGKSSNIRGERLGPELARRAPQETLSYVYAILHSPGYRRRYAGALRIEFPKIPMVCSTALADRLSALGGELTALHLLESPKLAQPITELVGGRNPEVEKLSWSRNTVWIDKAQSVGFRGVREAVWNFHIGGYQVCEKWLKDRKGRRLSNDDIAHYQKIVVALNETIRLMKEIDQVIDEHGGWPGAFQTGEVQTGAAKVISWSPRIVEPKPGDRYVSCVPLVPLKAAAGAFSDPQHVEDTDFEWVEIDSHHRLREGMFVAQVAGRSMEPAIPDGAYCLFRAPVEGTRHGKTVLAQLRDTIDPETGQRYTVKRYESEKATKSGSWRHERITLKPLNPDFEAILLQEPQDGELQIIAELVEVLDGRREDSKHTS